MKLIEAGMKLQLPLRLRTDTQKTIVEDQNGIRLSKTRVMEIANLLFKQYQETNEQLTKAEMELIALQGPRK